MCVCDFCGVTTLKDLPLAKEKKKMTRSYAALVCDSDIRASCRGRGRPMPISLSDLTQRRSPGYKDKASEFKKQKQKQNKKT